MKTIIRASGALIILIITIFFITHFSPLHVRADTPTDSDDPTAVYYCSQDLDADGNPVQDCAFGHFVQECQFQVGVESCSQDFQADPPTDVELFAPIAQQLASGTSFDLSASWNDTVLGNATSSLILQTPGTLSWSFTPTTLQGGSHGPQSFNDVLSTALLTLDLYKGVMGSSTLVFSQTVSSSTSGTIPVTFADSGPYFLAFSATYPSGTYPPGESPADLCANANSDFCPIPIFSLSDFQNAMTQGENLMEQPDALGNYVPAAYGLLPFTIGPAATSSLASNVLFLPGTLESRLYMQTSLGEHRVWEPMLDTDVAALAMNSDGTSKNLIYTRDIMDRLYSDNPTVASLVKNASGDASVMYGPFEDFMNGLVVGGTIKEWRAYPYDWRYDVSDIVQNGTLVGTATGTPSRVYLQDVVQELASSSPTGKVTIIAHSNGGLLAKALAVELQKEGKIGLLDQLILVGTPQLGTLEAIGTMLHGDGQTKALGIVMYSGTFRSVGLTTPGAYGLLPSPLYFKAVSTPIVSFANDTLDASFRKQYGASITSSKQLDDFLTNIGNTRTAPATTDLLTPAVLSSAYVAKAQATHAAIDTWTPPEDLAVTSIVGWGQPTIENYSYSTQSSGWSCSFSGFLQIKCGAGTKLERTPLGNDDGDNTVYAKSASAFGNVLYVDAHQSGENNVVHQNLLSATAIQKQIKDLLAGAATVEPGLQTNVPSNTMQPMLIIGVHSPMNVLATDGNGNGKQTGIVTVAGFPDFGFIKQDIPGSSVNTVDDEKYVSLPPNGSYTFSLSGYATGETTISVSEVDANGNATTTQTFANIPTTASTTATFSIANETATAPAVDTNGDGVVDLIASSSVTNTSTSTALAELDTQFSKLRTHYGIGALLLLTLEKLRLQKNPADIATDIGLIEQFLNAKIGDLMASDDASRLLDAIQKLKL